MSVEPDSTACEPIHVASASAAFCPQRHFVQVKSNGSQAHQCRGCERAHANVNVSMDDRCASNQFSVLADGASAAAVPSNRWPCRTPSDDQGAAIAQESASSVHVGTSPSCTAVPMKFRMLECGREACGVRCIMAELIANSPVNVHMSKEFAALIREVLTSY